MHALQFRLWFENAGCSGTIGYWFSSEGITANSMSKMDFKWQGNSDAMPKRNALQKELPQGFVVPSWKSEQSNKEIEGLFEEVRAQQFTSLPSRINPPCVFVCGDVQACKNWVFHRQNIDPWNYNMDSQIYKVCINGKSALLDGDVITTAMTPLSWGYKVDNARVPELARLYWSGKNAKGGDKLVMPELLCPPGSVVVLGRESGEMLPFKVGDPVTNGHDDLTVANIHPEFGVYTQDASGRTSNYQAGNLRRRE